MVKSVSLLQIQNKQSMVNGLLSAILAQNGVSMYKEKLLHRFLLNEDEPAMSKSNVGSSTILGDTPAHQPISHLMGFNAVLVGLWWSIP